MTDTLNVHFLVLIFLWSPNAFANFCKQVYPSEYAYFKNVYRAEKPSANCRLYPASEQGSENYFFCNGTQLILTDSHLGEEQYSNSDYYEWNDWSRSQLLFIFSTRVNLSTITLHYYSDSDRGLPRLRFYAVPDEFNVWDAPTASNNHVEVAEVPLGVEPAGRMNVSSDLNFTTKRVLLYKYKSQFALALSEVEFFTCNGSMVENIKTTYSSTTMMKTTTVMSNKDIMHSVSTVVFTSDAANSSNAGDQTTTQTGRRTAGDKIASTDIKIIIGIVTAIIILLSLLVIAAIFLILFIRKYTHRTTDYDSSYSTLCRESVQQMKPQSLHTSNDLYDQIQLSPSTGQAEFISTNGTANTNNPPPHQNEYGIYPSVDKCKPKSAKLKITASTISSQDEDKSISEQATYAVVNKKKKHKTEKESVHCTSQNTADQNFDVIEQNVVEDGNQLKQSQDGQETATQIPSHTVESPQELYTAVKKTPKARPANDEEDAPPIPPYTVEELYTAVQKKPKASTEENKNTPPVPTHTMEELYTAVKKKQKVSIPEDEEEAPPYPAHTVEELYSAVQKKPKVNTTEDEEVAPPVPPHTLD